MNERGRKGGGNWLTFCIQLKIKTFLLPPVTPYTGKVTINLWKRNEGEGTLYTLLFRPRCPALPSPPVSDESTYLRKLSSLALTGRVQNPFVPMSN